MAKQVTLAGRRDGQWMAIGGSLPNPGETGSTFGRYQDDASEVVYLGSGTHEEKLEKLVDHFLSGAPETIDAAHVKIPRGNCSEVGKQ